MKLSASVAARHLPRRNSIDPKATSACRWPQVLPGNKSLC
jgi:hypothetical protein